MIFIGIDPGVKTGVAVWDSKAKCFLEINTHTITMAMKQVKAITGAKVVFEDARQRKWFGGNANVKQQGAGSIKRDCKIWEDFLKEEGIEFEMIHPIKGGTKLAPQIFARTAKWKERTSEHARDAAMLVINK